MKTFIGKTASGYNYKRTLIGYVVGTKYQSVEFLLNKYGEWANQHKTSDYKTKIFDSQELADKFLQKNKDLHENLYIREYFRVEFN